MSATTRLRPTPVAKADPPPVYAPVDPRPEPERSWDDEYRWEWIAENAYYRAERRGFLPGFEVEDWLAAEHDLEQLEQQTRAAAS